MIKYQPHTEKEFEAEDLLPCPFCNGKAEINFIGNSYTKRRSATVKCNKCFTQRTVGAIYNSSEWCARELIQTWNTRIY